MNLKSAPPTGPSGPSLTAADTIGPAVPETAEAVEASDLHKTAGIDSAIAPAAMTAAAPAEVVAHTAAVEVAAPTARIARALELHEISAERAVASLIDECLAAETMLTPVEQESLREHLTSLLNSDPHLAGLAARLGYRSATRSTD